MSNTQELLYSDSHEWVRLENNEAVVGISEFAQAALGDITFVDIPAVGDTVTVNKEMGSVESVKAASDLVSPVSGEVVAVNDNLESTPECINTAPYTDGWMIRVKLSTAPANLMDAAAYEAFCASQAH